MKLVSCIFLSAIFALTPRALGQQPRPADELNCPSLHGSFQYVLVKNGRRFLYTDKMGTKSENRAVYFTRSERKGDWQRADAIWRPISIDGRTGKIAVSCPTKNTLLQEIIADDNGVMTYARYTRLDGKHMRLETDEADRNGVYALQE